MVGIVRRYFKRINIRQIEKLEDQLTRDLPEITGRSPQQSWTGSLPRTKKRNWWRKMMPFWRSAEALRPWWRGQGDSTPWKGWLSILWVPGTSWEPGWASHRSPPKAFGRFWPAGRPESRGGKGQGDAKDSLDMISREPRID